MIRDLLRRLDPRWRLAEFEDGQAWVRRHACFERADCGAVYHVEDGIWQRADGRWIRKEMDR